jgi:hypothetical protein
MDKARGRIRHVASMLATRRQRGGLSAGPRIAQHRLAEPTAWGHGWHCWALEPRGTAFVGHPERDARIISAFPHCFAPEAHCGR